jgi:hypothetical protein
MSSLAVAQTAEPGFRLTLQSGEAAGSVSRDVFGKPCLDIEAASRARASNPNVYDHIVSILNRCTKNIRLEVCYFGSNRCTRVEVNGLKRKDAIIGINPGMKTFRFSYRELK